MRLTRFDRRLPLGRQQFKLDSLSSILATLRYILRRPGGVLKRPLSASGMPFARLLLLAVLNVLCTVQLCTRKSFHRLKQEGCTTDSLLMLAAEVAWRNIDLYSQRDLDALPVDLAQHIVDKLVFAGKLEERLLKRFAQQQLTSLQLGGCLAVTNAWLAWTSAFALQRLSLAGCPLVSCYIACGPLITYLLLGSPQIELS